MNKDIKERYKQIRKETQKLKQTDQMISNLDINIRKIRLELSKEESTYLNEMNKGELPFPEESLERVIKSVFPVSPFSSWHPG